jgi:23S rRNA (cytosine1962-C5)-methyltransferase
MVEGVLRLKRGRERARVHPWIFKGDVADVTPVEPGSPVTVVDATSRFVGRGFYNPRPALCCRILTRADERLDARFFGRRLAAAVAVRAHAGSPPSLARLVWSEADGLSGLVVDRYGPVLALQCLTLGMTRARSDVATALRAVLGDFPVFERDDEVHARLEGFEPATGWLAGAGPEAFSVEEGAIRLGVRLGSGHKTGLYLDQRENRLRAAALAAGRDVLDAFCYTAGFACHALVGGARRALCLESSPDAIAGASANLALNGVGGRAEVRGGNAFDEFRRLDRERARFGLIVLDPPPFARGRDTIEAALRGYREVNLRAMRLLDRGGRLLTFSCSHHVTGALFEDVCREAAADARVTLRVLAALTQSSDHPVLLTVPETRYLKGLLLEAT